jgi:hypothetical protein
MVMGYLYRCISSGALRPTYRRQTNRHDLFESVWEITLRVETCDTICLLTLDTICLH